MAKAWGPRMEWLGLVLIAVPVLGFWMGGVYALPAMKLSGERDPWLCRMLLARRLYGSLERFGMVHAVALLASAVAPEYGGRMALRYDVTKTFPPRGPLQQYRLASSCAFVCVRCGAEKVSKLVTVVDGSWERLLCNGCYGRLLALFEVRAGSAPLPEKAARLAELLASLATDADVRRAAEFLQLRRGGANFLTPDGLRFLATAGVVAERFQGQTELDWSAAVIGLCKAFEIELVHRVVEPLRAASTGSDLTGDLADPDLGRMAKYCSGRQATPPEMGTIRHVLETAEHSATRSSTSVLLQQLRSLVKRWPHGAWLLRRDGALTAIATLTSRFRNRAAHTDVLGPSDYAACESFVSGDEGVIWELVKATRERA